MLENHMVIDIKYGECMECCDSFRQIPRSEDERYCVQCYEVILDRQDSEDNEE